MAGEKHEIVSKIHRPAHHVINSISESVRMKIVGLKVKRSERVLNTLGSWNLVEEPSLIQDQVNNALVV